MADMLFSPMPFVIIVLLGKLCHQKEYLIPVEIRGSFKETTNWRNRFTEYDHEEFSWSDSFVILQSSSGTYIGILERLSTY
jgi:hypothetical protein